MKDLLKHTYNFQPEKIGKDIERLWRRYQKILDGRKTTWDEINEARAILYFIGYIYPEIITAGSLERRVPFIKPRITLDKFLSAIDGNDQKIMRKYRKNKKFIQLKKFYLIVKRNKNRVKNGWYLDEGRFNEKYAKLKPKGYY